MGPSVEIQFVATNRAGRVVPCTMRVTPGPNPRQDFSYIVHLDPLSTPREIYGASATQALELALKTAQSTFQLYRGPWKFHDQAGKELEILP